VARKEIVRSTSAGLSATNRDPERAVRDGQLRQDLYFRLNVVPIRVPPLRERPEDIPTARAALPEAVRETVRPGWGAPRPAGLQALRAYSWPGNVRELQNVIERIVSLSPGRGRVTLEDLPEELLGRNGGAGRSRE
jgi:transcriptional regulator with PAS, ATPase and Fis domain